MSLQGIILWIWCISMMLIPAMATPSNISEDTLRYETVTWKLADSIKDSKSYTTFLSSLRSKFKASEVCKFPVTTKTPTKAKQFVLVDIINTNQRTVTLALGGSDAYFLGYRDVFNGAPRANFVKDNFAKWKASDVFKEVKQENRLDLPFESSYASMEKVAKLGENGRQNLPLGVTKLDELIDKVYDKDYKGQNKPKQIGENLAKFGLTVIQMVSEAMRFLFIENVVTNQGLSDKYFFPDDDMILLEKEWGKISEAIHVSSASKPPCQKVSQLDFPSDVDTVEKLRETYISLLKFKKSQLSEFDGNTTVVQHMGHA